MSCWQISMLGQKRKIKHTSGSGNFVTLLLFGFVGVSVVKARVWDL